MLLLPAERGGAPVEESTNSLKRLVFKARAVVGNAKAPAGADTLFYVYAIRSEAPSLVIAIASPFQFAGGGELRWPLSSYTLSSRSHIGHIRGHCAYITSPVQPLPRTADHFASPGALLRRERRKWSSEEETLGSCRAIKRAESAESGIGASDDLASINP